MNAVVCDTNCITCEECLDVHKVGYLPDVAHTLQVSAHDYL